MSDAFDHYELPLRIFQPLYPLLPKMPRQLIEYALYILGETRDPDARPVIEPFLTHPDPAVRLDAAEALAELTSSHADERVFVARRFGVFALLHG